MRRDPPLSLFEKAAAVMNSPMLRTEDPILKREMDAELAQFKAPMDLPITDISKIQSTPSMYFNQAEKYLSNIRAKGFLPAIGPNIYITSRDNSSNYSKAAIHSDFQDPRNDFSNEPYMRFWLQADIVSKILQEIADTPFIGPEYAEIKSSIFIQEVALVVRKMKKAGLIKDKIMSHKELQSAMSFFITTVQSKRKEVFEDMFKEGVINKALVQQNLAKEFSYLNKKPTAKSAIPRPPTDQMIPTDEIDGKIIESIAKSVGKLPPLYRFSFGSRETSQIDRLNVKLEKEGHAAQSAPCVRIPFVPQSKHDWTVHHTFYKDEDPLKATREGQILDDLETMEKISGKELDQEKIEDEPFEGYSFAQPEKSAPSGKTVMLTDDIWNTAELSPVKAPEEEKPIIIQPSGFRVLTKSDADDLKSAMEFAQSSLSEKGGLETFRRLQIITSRFGFTIQQKIQFILKYTSSSIDSQRLGDAISFWEMSFDGVGRYHAAYESAKEYLKYDLEMSRRSNLALRSILEGVASAERGVVSAESNLRINFGDNLIINGQNAVDLMLKRREKLKKMIEDAKMDILCMDVFPELERKVVQGSEKEEQSEDV